VAAVEKTRQAVILAFKTATTDFGVVGTVGVLRWTGATNGFEADFTAAQAGIGGFGGFVLTNPETQLTWLIGLDNAFTCADVDGDGVAEVIVQSDGAASLGLLEGTGRRWSRYGSIPPPARTRPRCPAGASM